MTRLYSQVMGTNCVFTVYASEVRNENSLTVHSQNMGKTLFHSDSIHDSDVLKIIRTLEDEKYSRKSTKEICKVLNKKCRHLDIPLPLL